MSIDIVVYIAYGIPVKEEYLPEGWQRDERDEEDLHDFDSFMSESQYAPEGLNCLMGGVSDDDVYFWAAPDSVIVVYDKYDDVDKALAPVDLGTRHREALEEALRRAKINANLDEAKAGWYRVKHVF